MNQLDRNVFRVTIPVSLNKNWESWFLLTSDQHWDNPKSNHELQKKHLNEALAKGAGIMSAGDYFCAMQGKFDKRSSKASIRPEHQKDNYLDALVSTAADFLEPYAKNYVLIATGNHEQSIADRYETNLIDQLCGVINAKTKASIRNGGFSGWIIFSFVKPMSNVCSIALHYDHGYGGGGPVTADMIQTTRRMMYLPDADIICHGHTHDQWLREFARVRIDRKSGNISHDIQTHIKLGTYKEEYQDGYKGWHVTRGGPPKPIGAWWLKFTYSASKRRVIYDVIAAK